MWSYYHDKKHQIWLWWAVDHATNIPLAYTFGTREHKYLDELLVLLNPFKIGTICSDFVKPCILAINFGLIALKTEPCIGEIVLFEENHIVSLSATSHAMLMLFCGASFSTAHQTPVRLKLRLNN